MKMRSNDNHLPHYLCIDDLFANEDSPAHSMEIPDEFEDYHAACDWVEEAEKTPGVVREDFYIRNENHGDNMGNAMAQGQIT